MQKEILRQLCQHREHDPCIELWNRLEHRKRGVRLPAVLQNVPQKDQQSLRLRIRVFCGVVLESIAAKSQGHRYDHNLIPRG